jgi:hypothetical protein
MEIIVLSDVTGILYDPHSKENFIFWPIFYLTFFPVTPQKYKLVISVSEPLELWGYSSSRDMLLLYDTRSADSYQVDATGPFIRK